MGSEMTRRTALGILLGGVGAAAQAQSDGSEMESEMKAITKGNLKQSVCRWCYRQMSLDELCKNASEMGYLGIDLLGADEWEIPKKYGMICAIASGPGKIPVGWNRKEHHDTLVEKSEELLPQIAKAGVPNMIVFSGNRAGISDEEGLENCVQGLKRIMSLAEKRGVTVCMELLNSKRNHKDYQCDHTPWGAEVCKRVGSDRLKLLYDIYHMQIMEGDIIATIQENSQYIGHYHTGGVPGRNEIDDSQELNYRTICEAIVKTGFQGFLAQEFVPKGDPMTSLREAARICDA